MESMPGKPDLQRTNMNKKALYNIRGIGYMFNQFPSTFEHGVIKPLYKVLRLPTMDTLN